LCRKPLPLDTFLSSSSVQGRNTRSSSGRYRPDIRSPSSCGVVGIKESSTSRRKRLASSIDALGIEMPSPCSRCKSANKICKVDLSSGRCSFCIAGGRKCDLVVTEDEKNRLRVLRQRVHAQLVAAEEAEVEAEFVISELEKKAQEALLRKQELRSRKLRLRKQLGLLSQKEENLFASELASIEEVERLEREASESVVSGQPEFGELALPEVPSTWLDDLPQGEVWDQFFVDASVGETVVGVPGTS